MALARRTATIELGCNTLKCLEAIVLDQEKSVDLKTDFGWEPFEVEGSQSRHRATEMKSNLETERLNQYCSQVLTTATE